VNTPILAIDIGSTKICAIIGKIKNGHIEIAGHGLSKSQGIKKGAISNIELASKSIKDAVDDAKRVAGINLTRATISISGAYVKSLQSSGVVNIPNQEISITEINRVMQTALYNANIPNEYEVLHVLPYKFKIDEQDFIEDPNGMNASRMETDTHIIITNKSNLENLKKAVHAAGIDISKVVLSGYASLLAITSDDDRERGVAVIDLGGQTSNLVIHVGNAIQYNDYLAVGSNHITSDLSIALHTPLESAENLKITKGTLFETEPGEVQLEIIGDEYNLNSVSLDDVHSIIYSRMEETLSLLANSLQHSELGDALGAGLVLTGGMTHIEGTRELAQALMPNIPVRIGKPTNITNISKDLDSAEFSTVIGLIYYESGEHTEYELDGGKIMLHSKEYRPKDDLSDIRSLEGISANTQPKISVSTPSFNENGVKSNDLFEDLTQEPKRNQNNPIQNFMDWASKIF